MRILFASVTLALVANAAVAQPAEKLNPDVSVIGDIRLLAGDDRSGATLELEEVEFGFVGPLNPYASAAVFAAVHGGEFEIEEAYMSLDRYLPGGLGLRAGRMLLDFGQLNPVHAHAYPFIDRPLMHSEFFGEDGIVDISGRLDWLAPIDAVTLQASAGAVRGDVLLGGHHHHEEEHDHEEEARGVEEEEEGEEEAEPKIGGSGRLQLFLEPSEKVAFSIGGSVLTGVYDVVDDARATWIGADVKGRFDLGPNRALILNGEVIFGTLDESDENAEASPNGFFASADLRANKRWNVGGFVESTTERLDDDHRTDRFGGFLGFGLMEETTLFRVVGRRTEPAEGDGVSEVIVQAIFGLGPHAPHRF